jgi:biopolymer transport protein ExbD
VNLRPRRSEDPEINLISLIDILLVLVIFFILSTTFSVDGRMRIQLPQASAVPVERRTGDPLVITVTAAGGYLVNGRELVNASTDTLRAAILKAAGDQHDTAASLRADGRATHQSVVTAMDVLGKLGYAQLNIVTTKEAADAAVPAATP